MVDEEKMGAVDPNMLLKALSPLLSDEGGVKGVAECVRIVNLMKDSKKLVSRCVYLSVLKSTNDEDVMKKFICCGGWETMNTWLHESKEDDSVPFLLELLKVFRQLPVSIDLLKKNNTAKTVKQLSKADNERVKSASTEIVNLWMEKIKSNKTESDSKSSDSSSSKHKSSKDKKERHKEKSGHSSHHHHHHHKKQSPHKDEKSKDSSSTKDKNANETSTSKSSSAKSSKDEKTAATKPSAKTAPHKFRSTGNNTQRTRAVLFRDLEKLSNVYNGL